MRSEELSIVKVLFNTKIDDLKYKFTQGMWFEKPDMTKVLFDIQTNSRTHDI